MYFQWFLEALNFEIFQENIPLDPPLKITRLSDGPIYLGTSMITDGIGQHKVLLLINHNHNKICDILGSKF